MRVQRRLLRFALGAVLLGSPLWPSSAQRQGDGLLAFTPHDPTGTITAGSLALGLGRERDGFLFVPRANGDTVRMPLLILLHGATQRARLFERLLPLADSVGVVILAPDSREMTWDAVRGKFGPDVAFLDRAIMQAFDKAHIDPCRVAIGGFSDGASYALSLGIRNADRLRGVVALSPGFMIPAREMQKLPVFMRHGTGDRILPIERTSRRLVRALRGADFDVDYSEFDGPHTMRPADVQQAMQWVTRRSC